MPDMTIDELVGIGERVSLLVDEEEEHRSIIQDIRDETLIYVSAATRGMAPLRLTPDARVDVLIYRPEGLFFFPTAYRGDVAEGRVRMMTLEALSQPERWQRRMEFRLPIALPVSVRPAAHCGASGFDSRIRDLSSSGAQFEAPEAFAIGERLRIAIQLDAGARLDTLCEVRRAFAPEHPSGRRRLYLVGAMFLDLPTRTQNQIAKFLFEQQILRRGRR